jgi:hypothetical protein
VGQRAVSGGTRVRRERIRPLIGRPYRSTTPELLIIVTRDEAAMAIIGRHACAAGGRRLRVGGGEGRKGSGCDDCHSKCDLCYFGHGPISFDCSPPWGSDGTREMASLSFFATAPFVN